MERVFLKNFRKIAFIAIIIFTFNSCSLKDITYEVQEKVVSTQIGEAEIVESISGDKYAYGCLSDDAQIVYDQVLNAILSHSEETVISARDPEVLSHVVDCLYTDYGGLFWVSGYEYKTYESGGRITGMTFLPTYTMTKSERDNKQGLIDAVVRAWLDGIKEDASDYEKSKFIYEKLINEVDYDFESEDNQNIISVFLNGKTVCQGYANAASYLLNQLGIDCLIVTGESEGELHAWNLVKLDGEYYNFDATWGNSDYKEVQGYDEKIVNYAYLNVPDEGFYINHTPKMNILLPEATSMADNYFTKEKLYYTYMDGDNIARRIGTAYLEGQKGLAVKFANQDIYSAMREYLIDAQHFGDYAPGLTSIKYLDDSNLKVITFWF